MKSRIRKFLPWLAVVLWAAAESPKTIVDLQPFRTETTVHFVSRDGKSGEATLIDLNSSVQSWYLLEIRSADGAVAAYHLENPYPTRQKLLLDSSGLVISAGQNRHSCDVLRDDTLPNARAARLVYPPLCEGRIYLRNPATGHRTTLEAATEFLREHVWGGEKIIDFGHTLMEDMNRETGKIESANQGHEASRKGAPLAALVDSKYSDRLLTSGNLGIDLGGPEGHGMTPGAWYPVRGVPGVYVSLLEPDMIDAAILGSYSGTVSHLDDVEASALSYLIAFDLDRFDLGFALGTEYPGVGWSDRALAQQKDPKLVGPDGIGKIAPLVATGLIAPENAGRTVATFTGGFKRTHGAFKYGDLALRNSGSHYGFIEAGVVFSKLQPGLATVFVLDDGSVQMKTWTDVDSKLLNRIKYARQNGVPLVEWDQSSQSSKPGALVARWGDGNWSGSQDAKLRTIRSGAAIQISGGKRFLVYAVFSSATPSAMARIFQAYRCDYAMLLDMNALEHTYCALYRRSGRQLTIGHLIKGMSQLDKSTPNGAPLARFLAYPDNRDFFYVMRREIEESKP